MATLRRVSSPVTTDAPLPPVELAARVGPGLTDDTLEVFDRLGRDTAGAVRTFLPRPFAGHRFLDFGCGSGKVLRHLLPEAAEGEVWGCDIDAPSIEWLQANLSPPLHVFVNGEAPPLPGIADEFFDVVFASSVFTHISDEWAPWLVELHRVLRPGGVLVSTFLGNGMSELIAREPWDEDRIGMNVLLKWQGWDVGGPCVLHSPWWLRAHWGRIFTIELVDEAREPNTHGLVVARKDDRPAPTVAELEALEPDEPREIAALRHNIRQLEREAAVLAHAEPRQPSSGREAARVLAGAGRRRAGQAYTTVAGAVESLRPKRI